MKNLTAAVALLSVFTLAICFILIGAISEETKARLGIDNSQVGSLASALFLTSLAVQLFVGPLVDKVGHKTIAVAGFCAAAAAIFLLAFAADFTMALAACSLLGLGGLVLVFGLLALFAEYPPVSTGYRISQAVQLLREPPVLVASFALLCYIALEISMNTWIKPLMTEFGGGSQNPVAAKHATWVLSLFGLSMAVGRFGTSMFKGLTAAGPRLIAGASLVAVAAITLMTITRSFSLAVVAVILVGLALAPIFPTIVGVTLARYDPGLYGSIFGIMFVIGLIGPTTVPKIIGGLSIGGSIQKSLPIAAVLAIVLCALTVLMGKIAPRQRTGVVQDGPGARPAADTIHHT